MTDYTNTSQQEMEDIKDIGWALLQVLAWIGALSFLVALFFTAFYGA